MNEEQPSYKVTDRRLFNPDGSPREVPPEEKPEPVAAAKTASEAVSPAAPQVKPRAARPHPVAAKKAGGGDAKAKAEAKSEAKPKTAVKKSRKPKA